MTIAQDIIDGRMPDLDFYLREGISLDDWDEYGFTPLIESIISDNMEIFEAILARNPNIDTADASGRTPLHWAVFYNNKAYATLLLEKGANPNAYTKAGLPILVYPLMRQDTSLKHLLYQNGAKIDFAQDFINAKSVGHRFELPGWVDIYATDNHFIEVEYEGFIIEFTIEMIKDSLRRFMMHYSTRQMRHYFPYFNMMADGLETAQFLLSLQLKERLSTRDKKLMAQCLAETPLLILPAASRGHAMCFLKYHDLWVKIDRGENSKKEGSVNIYRIGNLSAINEEFLEAFIHRKQPRDFFHRTVNKILKLELLAKLPVTSQISGNCSWANIQALVPASFAILSYHAQKEFLIDESMRLFSTWLEWDKDRVLNEVIKRFYTANPKRQATIASMLAAVLFYALDASNKRDLSRVETIMPILELPDYRFILNSYLNVYCVSKLSRRGNNLLKLLEDSGVNPNIGVTPIATGLKARE